MDVAPMQWIDEERFVWLSDRSGFAQLYLNRQMTPTDSCVAPTGGKADLARLHAEIDALEKLLIRYRS